MEKRWKGSQMATVKSGAPRLPLNELEALLERLVKGRASTRDRALYCAVARMGKFMGGMMLLNKPVAAHSRIFASRTVGSRLREEGWLHGRSTKATIGHIGTLDPFASGVLPVFFGLGTRLIGKNVLDVEPKVYRGMLKLGSKTDSGDCDGQVVETKPFTKPTPEQLSQVADSLIGTITQTPSKYSAVKINGKPAYELARAGIDFEMPSRQVEVHSLSATLGGVDEDSIVLDVTCGTGTFIRTLGEEFAEKLGTCGHLIELERRRSGIFHLDDCSNTEIIWLGDFVQKLPTLNAPCSIEDTADWIRSPVPWLSKNLPRDIEPGLYSLMAENKYPLGLVTVVETDKLSNVYQDRRATKKSYLRTRDFHYSPFFMMHNPIALMILRKIKDVCESNRPMPNFLKIAEEQGFFKGITEK